MFKSIFWATLVCLLTLCPAVAIAASNSENPQKYTFLFIIQGLNETDLNGSGLPNIEKLKSEGISYQHVTQTKPPKGQTAFTSILGLQENQLLLTRALEDNKINCVAVDGTGSISAALAKQNRLELIAHKNDQLAMDRLLDTMQEQSYQFAAIYLDDTSVKDPADNYSESQRWSIADNQVGRVINQLIRIDKLTDSTIVITGGGSAPPLLIYNGGYNQSESFYHCRQLDIAPTICKIFNITAPPEMQGHILYESLLPTSSRTLVSNLKYRVNDLQKECLQYNQQINLYEKEWQSVQTEKTELKKDRNSIHRIISDKDNTVRRLSMQISLLKILGAVVIVLLLVGYIFQYRWLRKKFLIF